MALSLPDASPDHVPDLPLPDLPRAAAFSALDQALWDIAAQRRGVPLACALGSPVRNSVPLYANINRRTRDRSPQGFAASAREALACGHCAIKIAPFDEADEGARRGGGLADAVTPGLSRIEAVRAAIGAESVLRIDCHWRLDERTASRVIAACAETNVDWVECPLPETAENLVALARLRAQANARDMRLAGCEKQVRVEGFQPFLRAGAYDVMMPDVKYAGGLREMLRIAAALDRVGVAFSPHNPTGPICHAASLHVCAVSPALDRLEMQFDETPLFAALQYPELARPAGGAVAVPRGAGLGLALDGPTVDAHCAARWDTR
jgi:galactonate dehydratase